MIIVPGGVVRELQISLFDRVLDVIAPMPDLIDTVVEAFIDGTVQVREWPGSGPKPVAE